MTRGEGKAVTGDLERALPMMLAAEWRHLLEVYLTSTWHWYVEPKKQHLHHETSYVLTGWRDCMATVCGGNM